jgi:hypothetical protein
LAVSVRCVVQRICGLAVGLAAGIHNFSFWTEFSDWVASVGVRARRTSRQQRPTSGRGEDKASDAILKFLHGRMFLMAPGGFLGGYDDETLKALVAVAEKHEIQLIL